MNVSQSYRYEKTDNIHTESKAYYSVFKRKTFRDLKLLDWATSETDTNLQGDKLKWFV